MATGSALTSVIVSLGDEYLQRCGLLQAERRDNCSHTHRRCRLSDGTARGARCRSASSFVSLDHHIGKPCRYCWRPMALPDRPPTRDHVWPRSNGGTLNNGNKLIVCKPCNVEKGARSLLDFLG